MNNSIHLSTGVIRGIIVSHPKVKDGKLFLDIDKIGLGEIEVNKLEIGNDNIKVPFSVTPERIPYLQSFNLDFFLSNFHITDNMVWMAVRWEGTLKDTLAKSVLKASIKILQSETPAPSTVVYQKGQLGISVQNLISRWLQPDFIVQIDSIVINEGISISFS